MTPQSYGRQSGQPSHEGEELYRLLADNSIDLISKHTRGLVHVRLASLPFVARLRARRANRALRPRVRTS
jgi:hypothetical protein